MDVVVGGRDIYEQVRVRGTLDPRPRSVKWGSAHQTPGWHPAGTRQWSSASCAPYRNFSPSSQEIGRSRRSDSSSSTRLNDPQPGERDSRSTCPERRLYANQTLGPKPRTLRATHAPTTRPDATRTSAHDVHRPSRPQHESQRKETPRLGPPPRLPLLLAFGPRRHAQ